MDEENRIKRTPKACDYCRAKKIKCDGQSECVNCKNHNVSCTYNYIAKKRTFTKKRKSYSTSKESRKKLKKNIIKQTTGNTDNNIDNNVSMDQNRIENRLSKMESMMEMLVSSLAVESKSDVSLTGASAESFSDSGMNDAPSSGDLTDEEDEVEDELGQENCFAPGLAITTNHSILNSARDQKIDEQIAEDLLEKPFFGNYSSISLFSASGMRWMSTRLKEPSVLYPLKNLISNFVRLEHRLLTVWVDPIDKSKLSSLPHREVIEALYESVFPVPMIDDSFLEEARNLGKLYCDYRDGLILEPKFTYGELLLLNSTLLVACSLRAEKVKLHIISDNLPLETLKTYESYLLDNALFYFHRVALVSDGMSGIAGTLLLSFYADGVSLSHAGYLLVSIAARQAQDLGLHRAERYGENISKVRKKRMLSLFWLCYLLDQDISFKTARPPIINDNDVSAPPLEDKSKITYSHLLIQPKAFLNFIFVAHVDLSKIISKMHRNLFSSGACKDKDESEIVETVQKLLNDLEDWRNSLPNEFQNLQRRFEDDRNLKMDEDASCRWCMQLDLTLKYNYIYMVGTVFASKAARGESQRYYLSLGMDSAREILKFAEIFGYKYTQSVSFTLFYTFSAFLTLAGYYLQYPTSHNVKHDINLLISTSGRYFSSFSPNTDAVHKWMIIDSLAKCMLFIVIHVVKDNNPGMEFQVGDSLDEIRDVAEAAKTRTMASKHMKVIDSVKEVLDQTSNRNGTFCNMPVASLIVPPPIKISPTNQSPSVAVNTFTNGLPSVTRPYQGQEQQQQQQQQQQPLSNDYDFTNLLGFLKEETTPIESTNRIIGNDMFANDGESLFQTMFNIPNYHLDTDVYSQKLSHTPPH